MRGIAIADGFLDVEPGRPVSGLDDLPLNDGEDYKCGNEDEKPFDKGQAGGLAAKATMHGFSFGV